MSAHMRARASCVTVARRQPLRSTHRTALGVSEDRGQSKNIAGIRENLNVHIDPHIDRESLDKNQPFVATSQVTSRVTSLPQWVTSVTLSDLASAPSLEKFHGKIARPTTVTPVVSVTKIVCEDGIEKTRAREKIDASRPRAVSDCSTHHPMTWRPR